MSDESSSGESPTGESPVVSPVPTGSGRVVPADGSALGRAGMVPEDPAVLAAIVAAAEACWPTPQDARGATSSGRPASWRFSGRWWRTVAQARRERPWVNA